MEEIEQCERIGETPQVLTCLRMSKTKLCDVCKIQYAEESRLEAKIKKFKAAHVANELVRTQNRGVILMPTPKHQTDKEPVELIPIKLEVNNPVDSQSRSVGKSDGSAKNVQKTKNECELIGEIPKRLTCVQMKKRKLCVCCKFQRAKFRVRSERIRIKKYKSIIMRREQERKYKEKKQREFKSRLAARVPVRQTAEKRRPTTAFNVEATFLELGSMELTIVDLTTPMKVETTKF